MEQQKLNKNGFTLVEVLATIFILGLIIAIAIPIMDNILDDSEANVDKINSDMIAGAAILAESSDVPFDYTGKETYKVSTLIEAGFLDSVDSVDEKYKHMYGDDSWVKKTGSHEFTWTDESPDTDASLFTTAPSTVGDGLQITGYTGGLDHVVIPSTIDGMPVIEIGDEAFGGIGYIFDDTGAITGVEYRDGILSASIPEGVTRIGVQAFYYNMQMTSIDVPDTLESIDGYAFAATAITDINLPDGLQSIGSSVFNTTNLKHLDIPNSVTTLGPSILVNSSKLETVSLPQGLTEIPSSMFQGTNLQSIVIPSSVTTIGSYAFRGVPAPQIVLPDGLETINNYAFAETNVANLIIPDSVTTMGQRVFSKASFGRITLGGGIPNIPSNAFEYAVGDEVIVKEGPTTILAFAFNESKIDKMVLPDSITLIISSSLRNSHFGYLELPSTITDIGGSSMQYLGADELVLPDGLKTIGMSAFRYHNIKSVTIPDTVTSIGNSAFGNGTLESLTLPNSDVSLSTTSFEGNNLTELTIPSAIRVVTGFRNNKLESLIIEGSDATNRTIGSAAFSGNNLSRVDIGSGFSSISSNAFLSNQLGDVYIHQESGNLLINSLAFASNPKVILHGHSTVSGVKTHATNQGYTYKELD